MALKLISIHVNAFGIDFGFVSMTLGPSWCLWGCRNQLQEHLGGGIIGGVSFGAISVALELV